jgi:hypothetical protein
MLGRCDHHPDIAITTTSNFGSLPSKKNSTFLNLFSDASSLVARAAISPMQAERILPAKTADYVRDEKRKSSKFYRLINF